MLKKTSIVGLLAVAFGVVPAFGSIRIDFAGDQGSSNPEFRISDQNGGGISEFFELGSNTPLALDGMDFLRVSSVDPASADILNFIVTLPRMQLGLIPGENYGVDDDTYSLSVLGDPTVRIYHATDVLLADPLLTGTLNLLDGLLIFNQGDSGAVIEFNVSNMNVTNVQLVNNGVGFDGSMFPSLVTFALLSGLDGGADFAADINSAGTDLGATILGGGTAIGSANGDFFAVPEPGTMLLLAAGALLARRRR